MLLNLSLKTSLRHMQRSQARPIFQARYFAVIRRFTKSHEWVELDTDTKEGKVGITNHAQEQLGDIVYIDLPDSGAKFAK